jgi:hypothetical protein
VVLKAENEAARERLKERSRESLRAAGVSDVDIDQLQNGDRRWPLVRL